MKQLKSAELTGSKEKKHSQNSILKMLRNSRGFSLIELMITTGIGVIVSLAIASVFVFAMEQFTIMVEKNAAEEALLNTNYWMRHYLSQAVDVNAVTNVTGVGAGGTGQFNVRFDILTPAQSGIGAGDAGAYGRLAFFNREAGRYNANTDAMPAGGSDLRPTAFFVKDTNAAGLDPETRSAHLVIDHNSNNGVMFPDFSDLYFARLHRVRVQRITCNGAANGYAAEIVINQPGSVNDGRLVPCLAAGYPAGLGGTHKLKTITLEFTARYYKTSNRDAWNYRAPIGGAAQAPYRDIVQTIKINLKNNMLTDRSLTEAQGTEQRVHGSLYFFDYILPGAQF